MILLRGLPVGVEDVEGLVEQFLTRGVDLVEHNCLVRGERPLAVKSVGGRDLSGVAQRLEVANLEERAVDDVEPIGPPGHQDLGEHVAEGIRGGVMDRLVDRGDRHPDRGREVGRPEDDGLQARRRRTDLLDVDEAPRSFYLRLDADVTRLQARVLFDLGEEEIERHDVRGSLHLRQHDLVEARTGVGHHLDHIAVGPGRVPGVHPHAQHTVVPVQRADRLGDFGARGHLLVRRHRVFEIEEGEVGRGRRRLGEEAFGGAGGRKTGATR